MVMPEKSQIRATFLCDRKDREFFFAYTYEGSINDAETLSLKRNYLPHASGRSRSFQRYPGDGSRLFLTAECPKNDQSRTEVHSGRSHC